MEEKKKKMNLIYLKKEDICMNPFNSFEPLDLEELEKSISLYGLIVPLSVIGPFEDGKYTLIAGERRYRCICSGGEKGLFHIDDIPCHVVGSKEMSDLNQQLLIELSNLDVRPFNVNEHRARVMDILKQMFESDDITKKEVAEMSAKYFKTSDRYGRYWRRVFLSDEKEIQDLVASDKISIHTAHDLIGLNDSLKADVIQTLNEDDVSEDVIRSIKRGIADLPKSRSSKTKAEITANEPKKVSELLTRHAEAKRSIQTSVMPEPVTKVKVENDLSMGSESVEDEPSTDTDAMDILNEFKNSSKKVKISMNDLQNMDISNVSFEDLDFTDDDFSIELDASDRIGRLKEESVSSVTNYRDQLDMIRHWCENMLEKDEPLEKEWDVIQMCIEVGDKFRSFV